MIAPRTRPLGSQRQHDPISRAEIDSIIESEPRMRDLFCREERDRILRELDKLVAVRERLENLRKEAINAGSVEASTMLWAAYRVLEAAVRDDNAEAVTIPTKTRIMRRRCEGCKGDKYVELHGKIVYCEACDGQGTVGL